MCSQGWNDRLATASGYTSIDVKAVQTNHSGLADASHTMGVYLDQCCAGSNLCYGSTTPAVTRWATGSPTRTRTTTSTGSARAPGPAAAAPSRATCSPTSSGLRLLRPPRSEVRNAYNHNDTNGETVYHIGGYDGWWYSSWLLPGEDDGAVAYHSAGAVNYVTEPAACKSPSGATTTRPGPAPATTKTTTRSRPLHPERGLVGGLSAPDPACASHPTRTRG